MIFDMGEIIPLERNARHLITHRLTEDEARCRDADAAILGEIMMWAQVGFEIAKVRPVASATRTKALEIRAIIRSQPRLTND
jgi:hypothetical protein